jgi:hypothetical protein
MTLAALPKPGEGGPARRTTLDAVGFTTLTVERPTVAAVVDDARSALQIRNERFDVIVSEPSNPWVAGVATLYTPEFFQIVRSRLAEGGVFGQWVQLYQLPLPVVAGVVRNIRTVFPHVEVWFSSTLDLIVLASDRPLHYDRPWLERLFAPHTSIGGLGREWLGIDSVGDHFGRRLLGEAGVAGLAARGTLVHRDDRPQLEFVAARRFLDQEWDAHVFDSLVSIGRRAGDTPGTSPVLLARAMTVSRVSSIQMAILEEAHRARPDDPVWTIRLAAAKFSFGDTAFADSVLPGLLAHARHPEVLLFAAGLADHRGDPARRAVLLEEVLARGGDTAAALAGLAGIAARAERWDEVGEHLRIAFATARGSYRHPFPATQLREALAQLALKGPVPVADSVLEIAHRRHPGWAPIYELRAVAALRAGRCADAANQFLELLDFGIELADGREQLIRCRRGDANLRSNRRP